jgi:glycosyltransferase involved in cell wall biosynthesis
VGNIDINEEVIVVDDGSSDGTPDILEKTVKKRAVPTL